MARDAEQTKQRLLEAAIAEFSAYGIAGARVDRIAATARANKSLIYSYFGSKEKLFEAVTAALLLNTVGEAPITPDDLPGYAVALYDSYLRRPEVLRLSMWFRLEAGADTPEPEALRRANAAKVAAIKASAAGGRRADRHRRARVAGGDHLPVPGRGLFGSGPERRRATGRGAQTAARSGPGSGRLGDQAGLMDRGVEC